MRESMRSYQVVLFFDNLAIFFFFLIVTPFRLTLLSLSLSLSLSFINLISYLEFQTL